MDQDEFDRVKALIQVVCCSTVTEFEFESVNLRVSIRRREHALPAAQCDPQPGADVSNEATPVPDEGEELVLAPLAGSVYFQPSPTDKAYVEEGAMVEEGQVVALIEAMKMFNEVRAPISGQVTRLLVDNGQSVDAGTPLVALVHCARPTPCY